MKNRIESYMAYMDHLLEDNDSGLSYEELSEQHEKQLAYFMHERLVHPIPGTGKQLPPDTGKKGQFWPNRRQKFWVLFSRSFFFTSGRLCGASPPAVFRPRQGSPTGAAQSSR